MNDVRSLTAHRIREEIRRDLTELALTVGSLLNTVMDDDDREALQAHYERVLNVELHAGSENRRAALATADPFNLNGGSS